MHARRLIHKHHQYVLIKCEDLEVICRAKQTYHKDCCDTSNQLFEFVYSIQDNKENLDKRLSFTKDI